MESRMSILFGLITLSISLSWCNGYCLTHVKIGKMSPGWPVLSHGCADPHDGKVHELGTVWNSARCMRCECAEYEVECCLRFLPRISFPGCSGALNMATCRYSVIIEDRSKPCPAHRLTGRK